jgi:hypothetical protein
MEKEATMTGQNWPVALLRWPRPAVNSAGPAHVMCALAGGEPMSRVSCSVQCQEEGSEGVAPNNKKGVGAHR